MIGWFLAVMVAAASASPALSRGALRVLPSFRTLQLDPRARARQLHLLDETLVALPEELDPFALVHVQATRIDPPPRVLPILTASPKVQTELGVGGHMMMLGNVGVFADTRARVAIDSTGDLGGRELDLSPRSRVGIEASAFERLHLGLEVSRRGLPGPKLEGEEARGIASLRFDFGRE
jgi:hypothetical protein